MGLIRRTIPNLFQGVSQQPASLRSVSQAESMENCYATIVAGLGKRPPTQHVAKLSDSTVSSAFVATLNRDTTERYELILTDGNLQVFDLFTGEEKTVNTPNGLEYLTAANAAQGFGVVTVADYSFIVNKNKVVQMTTENSGAEIAGQPVSSLARVAALSIVTAYYNTLDGKCHIETPGNPGLPVGGYIQLQNMLYSQNRRQTVVSVAPTVEGKYEIVYVPHNKAELDAATEPYLDDAGQWQYPPVYLDTSSSSYAPYVATLTTTAAHGLAASRFVEIAGAVPESAYQGGFSIISVPSSTSFTFNCHSYTAAPATGTISYTLTTSSLKGSKQRFSDLPTSGQANGDIWQIVGEPTNTYDNYYVKWDAGNTVWVECPAPNTLVAFDAATMPHKLVREADGTFTFGQLEWDKRLVGDDVTNPVPSFVGRTISDVLFYRNRLGFLSDESLIMSRTAKYFNFWAETVTAVLDSDPIDVSASNVKVSLLNWAIAFNKALLLFSDQTQYQLSSGDVLTPKTVKLEAVTEFESSKLARPVAAGQNVFFALDKGNASTIREYFVDSETYTNDAADITAHVPSYLPGNVVKMAASSSEDVLFGLSSDEPNAVYVYKYYWGATEKLQSAWGKFTFPATDRILNLDMLDTFLYLTIQRDDGIYLEKLNLQTRVLDEGLPFLVHLDRRLELLGVYDVATNTTTWTLPYDEPEEASVVLGDAFGSNSGSLVPATQPTPSTVTAVGDYTAGIAYIGRSYVMRYRLSEQFIRDSNSVAVIGGRLQLRKMSVLFDSTGYFRAEVTAKSRDTNAYPFTGKVLGTASAILGKPSIASGKLSFPVLCEARNVTVELVNDSHMPSFLQSAEWEATYSTKASALIR